MMEWPLYYLIVWFVTLGIPMSLDKRRSKKYCYIFSWLRSVPCLWDYCAGAARLLGALACRALAGAEPARRVRQAAPWRARAPALPGACPDCPPAPECPRAQMITKSAARMQMRKELAAFVRTPQNKMAHGLSLLELPPELLGLVARVLLCDACLSRPREGALTCELCLFFPASVFLRGAVS